MRRIILVTIIAALTLYGCGRGSAVINDGSQSDTRYYVTFEGNPKIDEGEPIRRGDLELGRVLSVTIPNAEVVLVQIGIQAGNERWLRDSVAFYLQNNQLHHAELTGKGEMLKEGAKILGFAGKAQLYWFKTKAPANEVIKIAQTKAEKLYHIAAL